MRDPTEDFREAILAELGYSPDEIEPGQFQRFRTSDRRGDDAGWCKLFDDLRGGVFGDHRTNISVKWCAIERQALTPRQRLELERQSIAAKVEREAHRSQQWVENARRIARTWAQCVPLVPGDPVTRYLKQRGFGDLWPLPDALRLHHSIPYWHGAEKVGIFPAMVAPIVALDGRVLALHRTYLTMEGQKADVPSPKKVSAAAGRLNGACIPLNKPARSGLVGIAEGIETALAGWCASTVPTVAAYCAANLAAWQWPANTRRIVVFVDNDRAGQESANALRRRALAARIRCDLMMPTDFGADWCDVWAMRHGVTPGARAT